MFKVFDLRIARPELTLWQLAVEAKIGSDKDRHLAEKGKHDSVVSRQNLASTVTRDLKHARKMIANAGQGRFPGLRK